MRPQDLRDYLRLKRIADNAREIVAFRKGQRAGDVLEVRLRGGWRLRLRGGRQDLSLFRAIWLEDEYGLERHRGERWDVVVDLGANVGLFAAYVAHMAERVIACEPDLDNFEWLRRNTTALGAVSAQREAVDDHTGSMRLYPPCAQRASGRASKFPRAGVHGEESVEVPCVSLDDLFERHDVERCDLLKLDVEGAEYDILFAAAPKTLARVVRIRGEYHRVTQHQPRRSIAALLELLSARGFRVRKQERRDGAGLFAAER